jgi:hypothetical protein
MGWRFWANVLVLFALGVLGTAALIVKKKPDAKELIDKLAKFSGYIGAIAALWGVWNIVDALLNIGLLKHAAVLWLTALATGVVEAALGFIFGWGLATSYLSAEAKAKGEQMRQKLVPFQVILGLASLGLGVWWILAVFVIWG